MARISDGAHDKAKSVILSTSDDTLDQVNVNGAVQKSTSISVKGTTNAVELTDDKQSINQADTSSVSTAASWISENLKGKDIRQVGKLTDSDSVDWYALGNAYDDIQDNEIKRGVTNYIVKSSDGAIRKGDFETLGFIADVVGADKLLSSFPNIVPDCLKNYTQPSGLENNSKKGYADTTFIPSLNKLDSNWDTTSSGLTDLSTYTEASKDAQDLFRYSDRTKRQMATAEGRDWLDADFLKKVYRPYGRVLN